MDPLSLDKTFNLLGYNLAEMSKEGESLLLENVQLSCVPDSELKGLLAQAQSLAEDLERKNTPPEKIVAEVSVFLSQQNPELLVATWRKPSEVAVAWREEKSLKKVTIYPTVENQK